MKKIFVTLSLFIFIHLNGFAQITVTLSTCGANTFTLFGTDSTGRNIYYDANADYAINWNAALNQWEIVELASSNVWYTNTFASSPNPPCLSIGTWISSPAAVSCGNISDITGDCQSNLLGIEGMLIKNVIAVYPNPSSGQFNFTGLQNENNIKIYDMTRRLVFETQTNKSEFTFELSGEVKGMYWYRITDQYRHIKQGKLMFH